MRRLAAFPSAFLIVILAAVGCSGSESATEDKGGWVGTITTEGDVTTVVNKSGSVWGGAGTLVEQASIGTQSGPEPQLLGRIAGIEADDRRIYVLDFQVPAVRVYDHDGIYLHDIGKSGQGPGEYVRPDGLAVGPDGRVWVRDFELQRINVYEPDGTPLPAVHTPPGERLFMGGPLRITPEGVVFTRVRDGHLGIGPDGSVAARIPAPQFDRRPLTVRTAAVEGYSAAEFTVPFSPWGVWEVGPDGTVFQGFSSQYRIEVRRPDGQRMVIERTVDPVPTSDGERRWHERVFRRRLEPFGPVEGGIPEVPETKPYFRRFLPQPDGGLWVVRRGPGSRVEDCAGDDADLREMYEQPCWVGGRILDAFGTDGRYLGRLNLPEAMQTNPRPVVRDRTVIAASEDEAGTIMVTRYRLVLPGENRR